MELFERNLLLTKPMNFIQIQSETVGLIVALITGIVQFIDAKRKVTGPNHTENLVAELPARNVELGIDMHICALKFSLMVDQQLWWIEKNPRVSETTWNSSYFISLLGNRKRSIHSIEFYLLTEVLATNMAEGVYCYYIVYNIPICSYKL